MKVEFGGLTPAEWVRRYTGGQHHGTRHSTAWADWESEEFGRHDELPGRLELIAGKLCWNDEERLLLLGALLEHVGTARAVQLGPLQAWQNAVAMRVADNS